jgi:hypothetical protein
MLRRLSLLVALLSGCSPWTDVSRPEDAPTGSVLSPSDDAIVPAGRIELLGRVRDTEDPPENLFVVWSFGTAADDGWTDACQGFASKGTGETLCVGEVDPTVTRIRMLVKDVAGFQRVVTQDAVLATGAPLDLLGVVLDTVTAPEALIASWSSDLDGPLGAPTPDALGGVDLTGVHLSKGDHTLTLSATDDAGVTGEDTVAVRVDDPPTFILGGPSDGDVLVWPAPLRVEATLTDSVSPATDLRLRVTSDLSGELMDVGVDSGGHVVAEVPLSLGTHVLTLRAVDGYGLVTGLTRTVSVVAP